MNKLIFLPVFFIFFSVSVIAQTKSPTSTVTPGKPSPTKTTAEKNIESLKDKIADKVDELRTQNKQVTAGTINSIKGLTIDLRTDDNKNISISVDETLTKVYEIVKNQKKEIKSSDLSETDYIIVSGPVVENTVNANDIYKDTPFIVSSGQITSVDKDNFSIDIVTPDKEEYTLDIETNTKQQIMDIKSLSLARTGFSKFKTGDTIHFVSQKPDKEGDSLSSFRILVIPQEYF